ARTTTHTDGTSTSTIPGPLTAEERILKRNDVKARSILLMAIPNEHQLTFNQYKDAKTLFEAIQSRFGGNDAIKKTQKTLLKQTYENFNASSSESLDSVFNRLQKIVSQLSILGVNISQEDLNLKFLRCLPVEWNTHVVVWRNKPDLETMSIDDLYNNFKIIEQEVKGFVSSSSTTGSQNMTFVSTTGSTNEDTAHILVSTASPPVSAASTSDNAASLSDATVYAFLANQPYGSQIVHEDLEQIHDDYLEEMDLKWQLALLSMRAKKFYQRTGKKITINGGNTTGFDKTKVECFNCHKLGHFAREWRNPRGQDGRGRSYDQGSINQETTRRTVKVEEASPKAMLAVYGAGFDWSFMAEEEVPTNMALMAFSNSEGLASVEEQLAFYKQNEKLKKEKEDNLLKINNYDNATKSLDKVIGSQLVDNNKKGLGYNAIPPPLMNLFVPPSIDLSHSGIEKFKEPEFVGYVSEISSVETKKTLDAPIIEDWVFDYEEDEIVSKVVKSVNVQQKPKQANKPRNARQIPRYNRENKNELNSKRLGVGFRSSKRACFVYRSLNHQIKVCDYHDKKMGQKPVLNKGKKGTGKRKSKPVWNDAMRTNHQNFSNNRRNFSPKAVLTKFGKVPIRTARQSSPRAAVPISTAKPVNTAAPKSLTKRVTSAVGKKGVNAVKPSTCWVWRPKIKGIDHVSKASGSYTCDPQTVLKEMCDKKNSVLFTKTECLILSPDFKLPDENQVMLKIPRKDNMYSFDLKNIVPSKGLTCLIAKATNNESKLWHRRLGHINFKTLNKLVKGNLVSGLPSKIFENDHTCVACQKGKQHKATYKSKLVTFIGQPLQILHMDLFGPTFVKSLMGKMYCLVITDDYSRFSWVFFLVKKDETSGILRNFITGIENQLNHRVKIIKSDNGTEFKNQDLNQFCNSKGIKREYNNVKTPQQIRVAERNNRPLIKAARTMLADSFLPIPFWAEAVNTACYVQNRVLVTKPHNKTPYELLIGRPPIISFMSPFGCPVSILNILDHLGKFDGKADEGVLVGYSISSKAFRVYNHRTRKVEENLHVNFLENQPNIAGNGPKWLFDIDSLTNTMNYHPVSARNKANVNAGIEINFDARQVKKEKVPDQEYILLPLLHISSYGPSTSEEDVSSPHDDVAGKKIDQEPANEEDHTLNDDVDDMLHQEKMAIKHPDDARSQFEEECDTQLCKGMRTRTSSTTSFNIVRTPLNTASASRTSYPARTSSEPHLMPIDGSFSIDINDYPDDPLMPELEDTAKIPSTGIFGSAYDDSPNTPIDDQSVGAEADFNNMEPSINVSPIPTTRIHSIHSKDQIIGDPKSAVQTRRMAKKSEAGLVSFINKQIRTNHKDFHNCLFACFLSQVEPKKVNQALDDVSWVEAMQEELLQFKLLNVWTLVDLPKGKKAIGTKWVFKNKKDQRGIMVRNKTRLVAQGHRQEKGIYYDEVFAPVARIEAIRLFLAYALYMDFTVYQMDVKSAFLYGTIEEEVYVNQPPGFEDPKFPNKVYKVEKALYGLHQSSKAWYENLSTYLLENGFRRGTIDKTLFIKKIKNKILLVQVYVDDIIFGSTKKSLSTKFEKLMHKIFQMSSMGELTFFLGLQVEQRKDGIFLSQDKYVYDILKKFGFTTVKTASIPMETHKSLSSNVAEPDVDVYLYRSIIGTLMYLTSSRPDIMFAVCACLRFQVTPKVSQMHAVKRIFRYLKGKLTLGLWYPKDSPMDLIAYSDSDYVGASIDRKSTTEGCQFLGSRLVFWQCKKQTIVANSTTEAEYIAAFHCCG
ncbi:putative ribonuclease H-like domain-containing protein, partial [Tanacetum coccineum]